MKAARMDASSGVIDTPDPGRPAGYLVADAVMREPGEIPGYPCYGYYSLLLALAMISSHGNCSIKRPATRLAPAVV